MSRLERDRAAAMEASKASKAKAKRDNSAHTPGPWMVEPLGSACFEVKCQCGYFIATCHDGVRGDRNADVNARLIAGAPDLLAALQRIVAVLDKQVASPHLAERASPLAQAKAAIAKATGEPQ
mgnify:CR=1 FL=1